MDARDCLRRVRRPHTERWLDALQLRSGGALDTAPRIESDHWYERYHLPQRSLQAAVAASAAPCGAPSALNAIFLLLGAVSASWARSPNGGLCARLPPRPPQQVRVWAGAAAQLHRTERVFSMLNMRSAQDHDFTAKAVIRNVALSLFAEHGHRSVSVRQIAAAAAVSPALVLHHFGSKEGLREAVDQYAAAQLDGLLDSTDEVGGVLTTGSNASIAELFARVLPAGSPLPAYLRRLLLEGDPAGLALFRRWYEVSRALIEQLIAAGFAAPTEDPEVLAAFMLTADVALLVLRQPVADVLGFDPLSPEGLTRWAAEVARIYRDGALMVPEQATNDQADR